ncbi:unnamed protein product [Adineta steineri]|uniref:Envelope fusion glycoprotein n=1 Tax=Adineta steineri TaxID=433720 RepID=A0A819EXN8_9BILA|nr:unnamed protein product [Adineta steineri]CAF3859305.1 unnamed protein product [Adineta steineri]
MARINLPIVLILTITLTKLSKSDDLIIARQNIVHPTSGLILQYKSDYRPANKIVTFSTLIPMVADMCYLIPISGLKKIARCNLTTNVMNFINRDVTRPEKIEIRMRTKRFLTDIISIGVSGAALALGAVNVYQNANLKNQMEIVKQSYVTLQQAEYTHKAQILQLTQGELKLAMELNDTQQAISRTMELVNEHSETIRNHDEAIRKIGEFSASINNKLDAFMHAVEGHILHTSIEDILRGKPNLDFIHHNDMPKAIELITQAINISLEESNSSISLVDLVTRLLVEQEISFIPTTQLTASPFGVIIGQLAITSFFAASSYDEKPFFVYEPIPIPFNYANKRVRLAQMPAYIGIHPDSRKFVRWSREEAAPCYFELLTSCRTTPAIQKDPEHTCIFQILTGKPLTACRIEPYAEPVFVRRIGHYWAVSSDSSTKCHSAKIPNSDQYKVMDNHAITLPPIALIASTDLTPLSCDLFYLPGLPVQLGSKIVIYQNTTINHIDERLIDLHSLIHNNSIKWEKLLYIPSHIQTIIDFITNTTQPPTILFWGRFQTHSTLSFIIILIGIIFLLVSFQIAYFRFKQNRKTKVKISIPSWKTLEQAEQLASQNS